MIRFFANAQDDIYYFAEQGIVDGVGNDKFAPGEKVTREQFAKMMVLGFRAPLVVPEENSFFDVLSSNWSYNYIETCKDFLTGYNNPFGGKPSFRPDESATREDMAVALVRIMGYSEDDVNDEYYLQYNFNDYNDVSPALKKYMTIAVEKGIMKGYSDGSLRATANINRAEAVSLLSRATKQAVSTIESELEFDADYTAGKALGDYTIYVSSKDKLDITINGEKIEMIEDYMSEKKLYIGQMVYKFAEESEKTFSINAKKGTKEKNKELTVKYIAGAPELKVVYCPETSSVTSVTITGTVKDTNDDNPTITINDENVYVSYNSWSKDITLKEGENKITIKATNALGKTTTEEISITFNVSAPKFTFYNCPEVVETDRVTVEGKITDASNNINLYIDNEKVSLNNDGTFTRNITLHEGSNTMTFKAVNEYGGTTEVTKSIVYKIKSEEPKVPEEPTKPIEQTEPKEPTEPTVPEELVTSTQLS